jgi:hypothetical protein
MNGNDTGGSIKLARNTTISEHVWLKVEQPLLSRSIRDGRSFTSLLFGHKYVGSMEDQITKEKAINIHGRLRSGEEVGTTSDESHHV